MIETITAELGGREAKVGIRRPLFGQVADAMAIEGPASEIALVRLLVAEIDGKPLDECDFVEAMQALQPVTAFLNAGVEAPAKQAT